jgi:hypothetical protein
MCKTIVSYLIGTCLFLAGAARTLPSASADETNKQGKSVIAYFEGARRLSLRTDYLPQRVDIGDASLGARTIRLNIALDDKGGKGVLILDPNFIMFDAFGDEAGSTDIATHSVDVTLSVVERNDPARKARRLYEIKGEGLKVRLFLVVSRERTIPHRLLVAEKDGSVKQVFSLHDGGKGERAAF